MKKTLKEDLAWRASVKMFDADQKIPQEEIDDLLDTTVLSPSSFGLEPWKFVVVSDASLKAQLAKAGYDQKQFTTASHIVVMCVRKAIDETYVDQMIARTSEMRDVERESLKDYELLIKGVISNKSSAELLAWSSLQVYLATGVLLSAAAHRGIDASPMEGFDARAFDQILGLEDTEYQSLVVVALGYRSDQDESATWEKVRRDREAVVEER